jgi:hypothetical protein
LTNNTYIKTNTDVAVTGNQTPAITHSTYIQTGQKQTNKQTNKNAIRKIIHEVPKQMGSTDGRTGDQHF